MNLKTPILRFLFLVFCWMAFLPAQNNCCQNFNKDALVSNNKSTKISGSEMHRLDLCVIVDQYHIVNHKTPKEPELARLKKLWDITVQKKQIDN